MNTINIFPSISVFSVVCVLFYVLLSHFFVKKGAVSRTLKMQNKAKSKTAQIPLIPFMQRINKKGQYNPQPKNKPKQTQTKVAQASSLNVTPASSRLLEMTTKTNPVNPVRIKKMTSKPNFKNSKITLSDLSKTGYCSLVTVDCLKSKPNQTQYEPNSSSESCPEKAFSPEQSRRGSRTGITSASKIQPRAEPAHRKGRCLPDIGPSIEKLICFGAFSVAPLGLTAPACGNLVD